MSIDVRGDATGLQGAERPGAIFLLAMVLSLQLVSIHRQSHIGDAPIHFLAGFQSLAYGQNTLNWEHPPLVKMIAAAPVLVIDGLALAPVDRPDNPVAQSQILAADPRFSARWLPAARYAILITIVIPLLAVWTIVGARIAGQRGGLITGAILGLSFTALPHWSTIQTDAGLTLGFGVCVLGLLRYRDCPNAQSAALAGGGLGLALASKFSAPLFVPGAALLLILQAKRAGRWPDLIVFGATALIIPASVYAIANRHFDSALNATVLEDFIAGRGSLLVRGGLDAHARWLEAVNGWSVSAAQYLTGLTGISVQNRLGIYATVVFGHLSMDGRWWYFPAVLLCRTPLVVVAGLIGWSLRQAGRSMLAPTALLAPLLLMSIVGNYNIGIRHLLPLFALMALGAAVFFSQSRRWTWVALGLLVVESLALAPLWMSATNTWWLGNANPTRFAFSASDLEYRQNFKSLAASLASLSEAYPNEPQTVVYPLITASEVSPYIRHATMLTTPENASLAPGIYAVSIMFDQYLDASVRANPDARLAGIVDLAAAWRPIIDNITKGQMLGVHAGSFVIYRIEP